jgi:hypothetical protein
MRDNTSYKCTRCGKPAICTWNSFGLKWGTCEEHAFNLIDKPNKYDFNDYVVYNNGVTNYKKVSGGMFIYKDWKPVWIEFEYGGIAPEDTNGK